MTTPPMTEVPLSLSDIVLFLSAGATLFAVSNYYLALFKAVEAKIVVLEKRDIEYQSQINRLGEKLEDLKDWADLATNGNKEAVQHARKRFFADLKTQSDRISELAARLQDVQAFLAQNTNYIIRNHDQRNN